MPKTAKGKKIMAAMAKTYGAKKGKQVYYAMEHSNPSWHQSKGKKR